MRKLQFLAVSGHNPLIIVLKVLNNQLFNEEDEKNQETHK